MQIGTWVVLYAFAWHWPKYIYIRTSYMPIVYVDMIMWIVSPRSKDSAESIFTEFSYFVVFHCNLLGTYLEPQSAHKIAKWLQNYASPRLLDYHWNHWRLLLKPACLKPIIIRYKVSASTVLGSCQFNLFPSVVHSGHICFSPHLISRQFDLIFQVSISSARHIISSLRYARFWEKNKNTCVLIVPP